MSKRDAKDYAIEFGEYLAKAAERYLGAINAPNSREQSECYAGLLRAIYEFRKRAAKVPVRHPVNHDSVPPK